jgi:hypothetical protein
VKLRHRAHEVADCETGARVKYRPRSSAALLTYQKTVCSTLEGMKETSALIKCYLEYLPPEARPRQPPPSTHTSARQPRPSHARRRPAATPHPFRMKREHACTHTHGSTHARALTGLVARPSTNPTLSRSFAAADVIDKLRRSLALETRPVEMAAWLAGVVTVASIMYINREMCCARRRRRRRAPGRKHE